MAASRFLEQGQPPQEPSPLCTPRMCLETLLPACSVRWRHGKNLVGMVRPEEEAGLSMEGSDARAQSCLVSVNLQGSHPSHTPEIPSSSLQRSLCWASSSICCGVTSGSNSIRAKYPRQHFWDCEEGPGCWGVYV